ncbi:MAG: hypothetical protein KIT09_15880 [Bryobacteraceae bacterium]|nr:hypothetical protein [Bryobacteraceae bacterium]
MIFRLAACALCAALCGHAFQPRPDGKAPAENAASAGQPPSVAKQRAELNLLGVTDGAAGESRRNENVPFNLVDNNALKELNIRLGATPTIIHQFEAGQGYFGSEFGNAPSSLIHLAPAGRSRLHGNAYLAHLNSVFSARSFFQAGRVLPAHDNDYGFALLIPAPKEVSLSLAASQQKLRGNVNGNVLAPREGERTPLTTEPEVYPIVARFLAAFPDEPPNRTDINPRALNTNAPQSIDNNNLSARLDIPLNRRDALRLSYALTTQRVDAFQLVAGQNPNTDTKSHTARATLNRTSSATTEIALSAGFDRLASLLAPDETAVGPYVLFSNALQALGPDGTIPIDRAQNRFRGSALVRQARAAHTFSAGAEASRNQLNGVETDVHRGFFSFGANFGRDPIANLRMGTPTTFLWSTGEPYRAFRNADLKLFAGDAWKAAPGLTLHYGLRYEAVTAPVEIRARNEIPYDSDWNNFAPRFGLAWRLPRAAGVIRAAYGLHYGEIFPVTYQQIRFSAPGNYKINVPNPNLAHPLGTGGAGAWIATARPTQYILDRELATPYSHQYNLTWETEIARGWNLQLGYAGSRSHKLLLMWFMNRARIVPGIEQTTATVNDRRPDPRYADVRLVLNGSRGYYDAARVSLIAERWRGVTVETAYWWSKAIDLGSSYTNTANEQDARNARSQSEFDQFRDMKGLSPFDQPHALLFRGEYATPVPAGRPRWAQALVGGWTLSTVVLLKSGTPFTIKSGSDAPGFGSVDGIGSTRPHLLDPAVLGRTIGHPDTAPLLLPRSAFAYIHPTELAGSLGRNTFRKGGIRNVNAAVARSWAVSGDKRLTLRAESINLLNTPQFAEPGAELVNPNFGQITNTLNDGRTFRFLLRLAF